MHASLRKAYSARELEVRHSLLNLSVYNLVENCNYLLYNNSATIVFVYHTLIVTPIKNNNNLLNTINLHIKLRKLKEVCEVDALKQVDTNKRKARLDSLLDSNNYYLDSSLDINSKDNLENKKATIAKDLARE
ncbi:hypothetical protein HBH61_248120 [Parastagonospora nodorum]|nr:hypothetical protein HBH61_248120 [Parastagonospora nodorum]